MWERAPREPALSEAEGFSRAQRDVGSGNVHAREAFFLGPYKRCGSIFAMRCGLATPAVVVLFAFVGLPTRAQQPAIPSTGSADLDQYRASRIAIYTDDFGELGRYRDANAALKPPAPGENRVVFFGDSITDIWHLDEYFPGKPYINRGIGGQTTPQMLVRFRQDVIDLHPKVVVVLAGTNDIAGNTGPMRLEDIEANYASMADLARASNIFVIFSSVLPVHNYTRQSQNFFAQRSPEKILELNRW